MRYRAYSLLALKQVDDAQRIITGTATTPRPDRVGDVIEPLGVSFKNPLPLLWQHDVRAPVGTVRFDKPTEDGITFTAKMPKIEQPGPLKDRVDTAWAEIENGLIRGVSIGYIAKEMSFLKEGGLHFIETEVLELSLVTVPANADATIDNIKSIDAGLLAASGTQQSVVGDRTQPAGVAAPKPTFVKLELSAMKKPLAEQISALEAARQAKSARMTEIQTKASDESRTKDAAEKEEFTTLAADIKSIDDELVDLRALEKISLTKAAPVDGKDIAAASSSRGGSSDPVRVSTKHNCPPGTGFARIVWSKIHAYQRQLNAAEVARAQVWHDDMPEVEAYLKAPVAPGTTTDTVFAGPLVYAQNLVTEMADLLRPASIIGRIPGLTRVPFNIRIPRETTAASVAWVGEGAVKPVSAMAFDSITLLFNKVAGIVPVTEELFRFSSPAVDAIITRSLTQSITYLVDRDFLDPTKAAVTGVSPASITNGVTPITASGTTSDALRLDLGNLLSAYNADNQNLSGLVLVMTATQALRIALMRNTLGQPEFANMSRDGGSLEGIPVIVSENIVYTGGSPDQGSLIVAINANEILLADDGGVNVDVSREASLSMDTTPDSPDTASTVHVSLWQRNMVGIKVERFITWGKRRPGAVQFIQNAKYVG